MYDAYPQTLVPLYFVSTCRMLYQFLVMFVCLHTLKNTGAGTD